MAVRCFGKHKKRGETQPQNEQFNIDDHNNIRKTKFLQNVHFTKQDFFLLFPVVFFLPRLGGLGRGGEDPSVGWAEGFGCWAGGDPWGWVGVSLECVRGKPPRLSRRIPKPGHAAKGADGPGKHESPGQELPAGTCRNPRIHCQASTGTPGFTARALPSSWACPLSQTSHKASFHIPAGRESINPMDGMGGT